MANPTNPKFGSALASILNKQLNNLNNESRDLEQQISNLENDLHGNTRKRLSSYIKTPATKLKPHAKTNKSSDLNSSSQALCNYCKLKVKVGAKNKLALLFKCPHVLCKTCLEVIGSHNKKGVKVVICPECKLETSFFLSGKFIDSMLLRKIAAEKMVKIDKAKLCNFYKKSFRCHFGANCRFSHEIVNPFAFSFDWGRGEKVESLKECGPLGNTGSNARGERSLTAKFGIGYKNCDTREITKIPIPVDRKDWLISKEDFLSFLNNPLIVNDIGIPKKIKRVNHKSKRKPLIRFVSSLEDHWVADKNPNSIEGPFFIGGSLGDFEKHTTGFGSKMIKKMIEFKFK